MCTASDAGCVKRRWFNNAETWLLREGAGWMYCATSYCIILRNERSIMLGTENLGIARNAGTAIEYEYRMAEYEEQPKAIRLGCSSYSVRFADGTRTRHRTRCSSKNSIMQGNSITILFAPPGARLSLPLGSSQWGQQLTATRPPHPYLPSSSLGLCPNRRVFWGECCGSCQTWLHRHKAGGGPTLR